MERGEKLSDLEMKTAEMNIRAKAFADAAQQLSLKYKDKKWYQVWDFYHVMTDHVVELPSLCCCCLSCGVDVTYVRL